MQEFLETIFAILLSIVIFGMGIYLMTKDGYILGVGSCVLSICILVLRFYNGDK